MKPLCPKEEDFADYIEGRLSNKRRLDLETHFSKCDQCMEELMLTGSLAFDNETADLVSIPERIISNTQRIVQEQNPSIFNSMYKQTKQKIHSLFSYASNCLHLIIGLEPELVIIRGARKSVAKNLVSISKRFKDIEVGIEIEKINNANVHIRVKKADKILPEKSIRVTLSRNEKDIYSYLISGKEEILFEYIPYGHYALVFSQNGKKIGIYPFEIKETNHGRG